MTLKQALAQELVKAVPYFFALVIAGLTYLRQRMPIVKSDLARGMIDRTMSAASTAVLALEQTTVPLLKAKSADGTLSLEDAKTVKDAAVQLAKDHLGGDKWVAQAQQVLGVEDVEKFLADHVEAAVLQLTAHADAPPAPAPASAVAKV